jgi:hypothetical protein
MIDDPIVEEIHQHRAKHAARYGNDLEQICEALREQEKQSSRQVVYRQPRLKSVPLIRPIKC